MMPVHVYLYTLLSIYLYALITIVCVVAMPLDAPTYVRAYTMTHVLYDGAIYYGSIWML